MRSSKAKATASSGESQFHNNYIYLINIERTEYPNMKQLIAAILVLFTACVFAQEQAKIIECSVSPNGKTCFAEKPKKDAKLATVE